MSCSINFRLPGCPPHRAACAAARPAEPASCGSAAGLGSVNRQLRRGGRVQFEPEHAARPDRALHADLASHQFHQPLAHHQADARAFLRCVPLLSETVERLKKLHQHVRRQARAGVLDADANAFRGAPGAVHVHDHRSVRLVVLDRVGKKVDENLLQPGPVGIHKARDVELGKGHLDAALLPLRLDHGLAFEHDFGQRRRFQRQRQLSGLDLREIQDFVDQLQQIPSRVENLIDARRLGGRGRRGIGIDELGEAEDRIERRAQLMAHAGKEIRFREVGLFRRGPGSLQLDVLSPAAPGRDVCAR